MNRRTVFFSLPWITWVLPSCGNLDGFAVPAEIRITAPQGISLLAGNIGGSGNIDATGTSARLNLPRALSFDSAGNLYIVDSGNYLIRKVSSSASSSTFAGSAGTSGTSDGTGTSAQFNNPSGIALDTLGNLYVTDSSSHSIRKITPSAVVTTFAGQAGTSGSTDGNGTSAEFNFPEGIGISSSNQIYITDASNHTIRESDTSANVTTLAGSVGQSDSTDGSGAAARFNTPRSIAVSSLGNLFVADASNHLIRKVTSLGAVTTLAGTAGSSGSNDGLGSAAHFNTPRGIAVDASENAYVSDSFNNTIRKITPLGVVTTLAGSAGVPGNSDGTSTQATFNAPRGLALDSLGNLYICDSANHLIRKMSLSTLAVTTYLGSPALSGSDDATGSLARFNSPSGITTVNPYTAYVVDTANHTIRKVTSTGAVSTFAGQAGTSGNGNGTKTEATFSSPTGITSTSAGDLYLADTGNHLIRKITAAGVVTTLAGAGSMGSLDSTGTQARFNRPSSLALDSSGNLYVADSGNDTIRKITPSGVVSTFAGSAGLAGTTNGTGTAARFNHPEGIVADSSDNLYVTDSGNHTIRKITPAGVVTTLAGSAASSGSTDGNSTSAQFNTPKGITIDPSGNLYVADYGNHTIRKISPSGVVTTLAGTAGKIGIQLGALPSTLARPTGISYTSGLLLVTSENSVLIINP
ncbi:MAG: hypothetical protein ACO3A2_04330 [Bdellovibrionia bacterium]